MAASEPTDNRLMPYDVGTRPGAWVAEQTAKRGRLIGLGLVIFFLVCIGVLALAFGHHLSIGASAGFLILVLIARPHAEQFIDRHIRLRGGTRAEVAVGETLNELRREGWILMHDIKPEHGANIDHVASGPTGVYLIETKERRYEEAHLSRVKSQARWLHDQLGVWVTPVICLDKRGKKPFRTQRVWVVPHRELLDWLRSQHNQHVEFDQLARFADSL